MALEIKQTVKLAQQLVITPQLQQAIKLLQLTRMELVDLIQEEMKENPLLEEAEPTEETDSSQYDGDSQEGSDQELLKETTLEVKGEGEGKDDFDWESYIENLNVSSYRGSADSEDRPSFENFVARKTNLTDHLMWQLRLSDLDERQQDIGRFIIGNLDENGYLNISDQEISEHLGCDPGQVEEVLKRIRMFDPVGVGARDLRECLLAQLEALGESDSIAREIVLNHMPRLKSRNYGQIAKKLGVSLNRVMEGIRLISELEPKPGRQYSGEEIQNIVPDVFVYKIEGEYVVVLNEEEMPRLRINSTYRNILQAGSGTPESDRKYIQDRLRSAVWLLKSIHQRQRTIYRVTKSIVSLQREFLDKGVNYLRPMVLRDVAEDIQMHESTISRATNNKYVHTPQGIFELKYFFNNSISSFRGEDFASESVKNLIKDIIAKENPRKPYSDEKIVHMLRGMNINIARRTVAKYRESLRILSSNERKRLF
ncbi:MAG: RNA polymerase factor sigma-54 [Deltaproteobacteria bacterium]|nr:RNA polymerase factor sigma-54 [Deltaproteobacteria bacterium]MBW2121893.1 RNA polymerase factor sigma-54 [Deltaproteobacteria bacterium]